MIRKIYGKPIPVNWMVMGHAERLEFVNEAWRAMSGLTPEQQAEHRVWVDDHFKQQEANECPRISPSV